MLFNLVNKQDVISIRQYLPIINESQIEGSSMALCQLKELERRLLSVK